MSVYIYIYIYTYTYTLMERTAPTPDFKKVEWYMDPHLVQKRYGGYFSIMQYGIFYYSILYYYMIHIIHIHIIIIDITSGYY